MSPKTQFFSDFFGRKQFALRADSTFLHLSNSPNKEDISDLIKVMVVLLRFRPFFRHKDAYRNFFVRRRLGLKMDRDLNASRNILLKIPQELREFKPVETEPLLPVKRASPIEETGSHLYL
jgi:hypothetical protein